MTRLQLDKGAVADIPASAFGVLGRIGSDDARLLGLQLLYLHQQLGGVLPAEPGYLRERAAPTWIAERFLAALDQLMGENVAGQRLLHRDRHGYYSQAARDLLERAALTAAQRRCSALVQHGCPRCQAPIERSTPRPLACWSCGVDLWRGVAPALPWLVHPAYGAALGGQNARQLSLPVPPSAADEPECEPCVPSSAADEPEPVDEPEYELVQVPIDPPVPWSTEPPPWGSFRYSRRRRRPRTGRSPPKKQVPPTDISPP